MLTRLLDTLGLRTPPQVTTAQELRPGRAVVWGEVKTETPVRSPVYNKPCAAFYYRASFRRPSRVKGFSQALLRDALTFADGLTLHVGDAVVRLDPKVGMDFSRQDHQALAAGGIDGFRAIEKRVPLGARVAAHGTLRRDGAGWRMALVQLDRDDGSQA